MRTEPDCIEIDESNEDEDGEPEKMCSDPYQEIKVERSFKHADFKEKELSHDIGLVRLSENANLKQSIYKFIKFVKLKLIIYF